MLHIKDSKNLFEV